MDSVAGESILQAISKGVPLFNSGDAQQCYLTYRNVASDLVNKPDLLPVPAVRRLQQALDSASSGSAGDRAWQMRHGLDDVLEMIRNGVGQKHDGPPMRITFADTTLEWAVVDDRVMGGRSQSRMTRSSHGTAFEGELVLQGGGFASVRCLPPRASFFSGARALLLRCVGDGRRGYKLTLKTDKQIVRPRHAPERCSIRRVTHP